MHTPFYQHFLHIHGILGYMLPTMMLLCQSSNHEAFSSFKIYGCSTGRCEEAFGKCGTKRRCIGKWGFKKVPGEAPEGQNRVLYMQVCKPCLHVLQYHPPKILKLHELITKLLEYAESNAMYVIHCQPTARNNSRQFHGSMTRRMLTKNRKRSLPANDARRREYNVRGTLYLSNDPRGGTPIERIW